MVKKIMYDTVPPPLERIANNTCRLQSIQLIFVRYGQLNSTTILDVLHQACRILAI